MKGRYYPKEEYGASFESTEECLEMLRKMYSVLKETGFCPVSTFNADACFDSDKWGYKTLNTVKIFNGNEFKVYDWLTSRAFDEPISALRLEKKIIDTILNSGHIETIGNLMDIRKSDALKYIAGIGPASESAIKKALDEYYMGA